MNEKQTKHTSKFLSLVLRHQPETIGIALDGAGWIEIDTLLSAMAKHQKPLTRDELQHVVDTNDKKRFEISDDGIRIRASQGHSIKIDAGYEAIEPPALLYHGTPKQFVNLIRESGLKKMQRHHVHLSANVETATQVGGRRGKPVVLRVRAGKMHEAGFEFFVSANGVWLTDHVPPEFIEFPDG